MKSKEQVAHYIAALAQRAILYEVSATPKPGLVDRENSGSHKDMDFFTFMASSSALYRGIYFCTLEGMNFTGEDKTMLLDRVRYPGIQCEEEMFKATKGINTHKGIIFSIGILSAIAGYLYSKYNKLEFTIDEICNEVKEVCKDLSYKDFKYINEKKKLTHGEWLFKEYGYKGIRGEVESGFATVRNTSIPILVQWSIKKDLSMNDLFLQMIMSIMTESEDTNVVMRGGIESLQYVKEISKDFLKADGMYNKTAIETLNYINDLFVEKNISPGGAADLLAVSIFLGMLEGIIQ